VALLAAGLWFIGGPKVQRLNLWSSGFADIGWQHLAAAAEQRSSAARELPSDADMIADFQAHRGDFERLVALYQKHGSHGRLRKEQPEYLEYTTLLRQRGLSHLSGDGAIWLPDPYSADTAKKRPQGAASFHAFAHHGVSLHVEKVTISSRLRGGPVWKDYFYVPVVPTVHEGELWWPADEKGRIFRKARVLPSLDDFPPEWLRDPPKLEGCVFRQIEPQRFLRLCTSR
jgi:hypothetical protein